MTNPDATRACPYCAETIPALATICPVCGRDTESNVTAPQTQQPAIQSKKPRSRAVGCILVLALAGILVVGFLKTGFYTVQPLGALPEGITLLVWRTPGEPFFNSPDGTCLRIQNSVSLLCRMAAFQVAPTDRIILRLPYQEWAYLASTGGASFDR